MVPALRISTLLLIGVIAFAACDNDPADVDDPIPYTRWTKHVIDESSERMTGVSIDTTDMDGDQDLDLVVTLFRSDELVWYENPGWQKHIIDNADGVTWAFCADIDTDGTQEVIARIYFEQQLVYYKWNSTTWDKHMIDDQTDGADGILIADINKDNKPDIVSWGGDIAGDVVWFENQFPIWNKHIIEDGDIGYAAFTIFDFDQDGWPDITGTMPIEGMIVWFRNENNGLTWTKDTIDGNLPNAFDVSQGDINGDNAIDLLVTTGGPYFPGKEVLWYENEHPTWTKHIIDIDLDGATVVRGGFLDDDNLIDVIATGYNDNTLVWYEYDQPSWTRRLIGNNLEGPRLFLTMDVNGDQLNDVVVVGEYDVVWYEQVLVQ